MAEINGFIYPDKCKGCAQVMFRASQCNAAIERVARKTDTYVQEMTNLHASFAPGTPLEPAESLEISMRREVCKEAIAETIRRFGEFIDVVNTDCAGMEPLVELDDGTYKPPPCRLPGVFEFD